VVTTSFQSALQDSKNPGRREESCTSSGLSDFDRVKALRNNAGRRRCFFDFRDDTKWITELDRAVTEVQLALTEATRNQQKTAALCLDTLSNANVRLLEPRGKTFLMSAIFLSLDQRTIKDRSWINAY
jgi:hypothetical protein